MTPAPPAPHALVVPDAAAWAASGVDLRERGYEVAASPGRAQQLVLPERLPRELWPALSRLALRVPDREAVVHLPGGPLGGDPLPRAGRHGLELEALAATAAAGRAGFPLHEEAQGGGDHDEMMSVSGEPSADGLVMEPLEAVVGPFSPALAAGLRAELELDGDVACGVEIVGLDPAEALVDPLAPIASAYAIELLEGRGPESGPAVGERLAAVELERALSHSMWLARLAGLLGSSELRDRLERGAGPLIEIQRRAGRLSAADLVAAPLEPLTKLLKKLSAGGWPGLKRRTEGVAALPAERCRELGLRGPNARASGLRDDARLEEPAYRELGFDPVIRARGDAAARLQLRAAEALAALELALRGLEAGSLPASTAPVEGPRGPIVYGGAGPAGGRLPVIAGAAGALVVAAEAARGRELASALVAIASFDLSPIAPRAAGARPGAA